MTVKNRDRFRTFMAKIDAMRSLGDDWCDPLPNNCAMNNSKSFLDELLNNNLLPNHVDPMVEGGIAFSFLATNSDKECYIELSNDGEKYGVLMPNRKDIEKFLDLDLSDSQKAIQSIKKFFGAECSNNKNQRSYLHLGLK